MSSRILYLSNHLEVPPAGGPQLRAATTVKALSTLCSLHAYDSRNAANPPDVRVKEFLDRSGCEAVCLESSKHSLSDEESARLLSGYIRRADIHALWFGHATGGQFTRMHFLKGFLPDIRIVCDTDSVWSRFVLRALPFAKSPESGRAIEREGHAKELEEDAWLTMADVVTAVSEVDAQYYRAREVGERSKVHLFRNALDLADYPDSTALPDKSADILLAGSFYAMESPMVDATRWFLGAVWPLVRAARPATTVHILGRGAPDFLNDFVGPSIHVTGYVPTLLPYLRHAAAVVVPLRFESGTRFKILEAGACRKAVVSTTLGAEGLNGQPGEHLLIADEPHEFAAAILNILADPHFARRLGQNLRSLVEEQYSLAQLISDGREVLDALRH